MALLADDKLSTILVNKSSEPCGGFGNVISLDNFLKRTPKSLEDLVKALQQSLIPKASAKSCLTLVEISDMPIQLESCSCDFWRDF